MIIFSELKIIADIQTPTLRVFFVGSEKQFIKYYILQRIFDYAYGGLPALGLPEKDVEQRVLDALETVGASHLIKRPPYKLSGGEKRAVAIATILATSPDTGYFQR